MTKERKVVEISFLCCICFSITVHHPTTRNRVISKIPQGTQVCQCDVKFDLQTCVFGQTREISIISTLERNSEEVVRPSFMTRDIKIQLNENYSTLNFSIQKLRKKVQRNIISNRATVDPRRT